MDSKTLRDTVGANIAQISPAVTDQVVAHFVVAETNKRADAVIKGMDMLNQFQRELDKINRPDSVTFNADKTPASQTYTKARLDEIDKANKKIAKLTTALDKALDKGEMGDLYNLVKNGVPDTAE